MAPTLMRKHPGFPCQALLLGFAFSLALSGQYRISTIAGGGIASGLPADSAAIVNPSGVAVDANGNIYVSAADQNVVFRLRAAALSGPGSASAPPVLVIAAGNGNYGFSGDGGPATGASLKSPTGLAVDAGGNLYIADSGNSVIRKVSVSGVITTLAVRVEIDNPSALGFDPSGNLYITDTGTNRIVRVTPGGVAAVVAGNGSAGYKGDGGSALKASLNTPLGLTFDPSGNVIFSDSANNVIRRVDMNSGIITTIAGSDNSLNAPAGVVFTSSTLYIADSGSHRLLSLSTDGRRTVVAGTGAAGYSGDGGPASGAALRSPTGLGSDRSGNLLICDSGNNRLRKVDPNQVISTIGGDGTYGASGDGLPAVNARLLAPLGVAVDGAGNIYIADTRRHAVRRVSAATGLITTIAGNGSKDFSGDGGPATAAGLNTPVAVAVDGAGNVYIADSGNRRIRRVDGSTGAIGTIAGNGEAGFSGDGGRATAASLSVVSVALDGGDNLYFTDYSGGRIRRVSLSSGTVTSVAGDGGYDPVPGDAPNARAVSLGAISGIAANSSSVYVAMFQAGVYQVKASDGSLSRFAGNGQPGFSGDGGPALQAGLSPETLGLDSANLYIGDASGRIRRVGLRSGTIDTIGGNGVLGYGGDGGAAVSASIGAPGQLAADASGNVLLADPDNNRVRRLTPGVGAAPSLLTSTGAVGLEGASLTKSVTVTSSGAALLFSVSARADSGGTNWLSVTPATATTPAEVRIQANPAGLQPGTYVGAITLTAAGAANSPRTISVTLTVAGPVTFTVSPGSLAFSGAGSKTISVGSSGTPLSFTAGATTRDNGSWLSVSPRSGTTPATLNVTVNPVGLAPGGYSGTISLASTAAQQSIPVSLTIEAPPALSVSPLSLTFANSGTQNLALSANVAGLDYTVSSSTESGVGWLSVSPAGGTAPASLTVTVSAGSLGPGDYRGGITIRSATATNTPVTVPVTLSIGAPVSLVLTQGSLPFEFQTGGTRPPPQVVSLRAADGTQVAYRATTRVVSPPNGQWVSVQPQAGVTPSDVQVSINPAGLDEGVYKALVTFTAATATVVLDVTLVVSQAHPPKLVPQNSRLQFTLTNSGGPDQQLLIITNPSENVLNFTVSTRVDTGDWLKVPTARSGVFNPQPAAIPVIADPRGLPPSTYNGAVVVTADDGEVAEIPVALSVSANPQRMDVSSPSLLFVLEAGLAGSDQFDQEVQVIGASSADLPWSARVVSESSWLVIRNPSGISSTSPESRTLRIGVNTTGLAAGFYEGLIAVESAPAGNSPLNIRVQLDLRPRGANLGPLITRAGLVFTATAGGVAADQHFVIYNRTDQPLSFKGTFDSSDVVTPRFAALDPASGSLGRAGGGTLPFLQDVRVGVTTAGLAAGIYRGVITLQFQGGSQAGVVRLVNVVLVISPPSASGAKGGRGAAASCAPSGLVPVVTSVEDGLRIAAGDAVDTQLAIVDDCGNLATGLAVGAGFSNGDPSVNLSALGGGRWKTTWQAQSDRDSAVRMDITAVDPAQNVQGSQQLRTSVTTSGDGPLIRREGIVDNDTRDPGQAVLIPGHFIAILGSRLASQAAAASTDSFPASLGGVTVMLGGVALPLASVSPGEVIAQLPADLAGNTSYQLVLMRDGRLTLPETVLIGSK